MGLENTGGALGGVISGATGDLGGGLPARGTLLDPPSDPREPPPQHSRPQSQIRHTHNPPPNLPTTPSDPPRPRSVSSCHLYWGLHAPPSPSPPNSFSPLLAALSSSSLGSGSWIPPRPPAAIWGRNRRRGGGGGGLEGVGGNAARPHSAPSGTVCTWGGDGGGGTAERRPRALLGVLVHGHVSSCNTACALVHHCGSSCTSCDPMHHYVSSCNTVCALVHHYVSSCTL